MIDGVLDAMLAKPDGNRFSLTAAHAIDDAAPSMLPFYKGQYRTVFLTRLIASFDCQA